MTNQKLEVFSEVVAVSFHATGNHDDIKYLVDSIRNIEGMWAELNQDGHIDVAGPSEEKINQAVNFTTAIVNSRNGF